MVDLETLALPTTSAEYVDAAEAYTQCALQASDFRQQAPEYSFLPETWLPPGADALRQRKHDSLPCAGLVGGPTQGQRWARVFSEAPDKYASLANVAVGLHGYLAAWPGADDLLREFLKGVRGRLMRQITTESVSPAASATWFALAGLETVDDHVAALLETCTVTDLRRTAAFLNRFPAVRDVLPAGVDAARRIFGASSRIELEAVSDPESTMPREQLFAYICYPGSVAEGMALLDRLDDEWYSGVPNEVAELFNFNLRPL